MIKQWKNSNFKIKTKKDKKLKINWLIDKNNKNIFLKVSDDYNFHLSVAFDFKCFIAANDLSLDGWIDELITEWHNWAPTGRLVFPT